jgi:hypothetical protein
MMEAMFKNWLLRRGNKGAAMSYPKAINQISEHYSRQTGEQIDIYKIKDQSKISELARDYSQSGKFSEFGYEQHGRYRAAIGRYSDFFVESRGEEHAVEEAPVPENESVNSASDSSTNFAYEKDLQTALCSHISELFPDYHIYGGLGIGVEYSIGGKRIDVLLEHEQNKDLLVVELKSGEADFKVFGQISMYIGLLGRQYPERKIRGVIVAGSIDDGLVQACEITDKVSLKTYRMSIELEDA